MHRRILIAALLLLSACDRFQDDKAAAVNQVKADEAQAQDNVEAKLTRVATTLRDDVRKTNTKLRDWWLRPDPVKPKPEIAASYCYHVLHDVLCYRAPMPGWEYRLVAYQGTNAEPPPPAYTEPLATRPPDSSQQPATRVANAQPVFVNPPPSLGGAESETPPQATTPPDATHQQLPDPALAPQL